MCAWPLYRRLTVLKRVVISVAAVGVLGLLTDRCRSFAVYGRAGEVC
jgi:hypothetical protein